MKFEVVVTLDSSERLCRMVNNLVNAGRAVPAQIGKPDTEEREAPEPEKPAEPEKPTRAKSKSKSKPEPVEEKPVPVNYEPTPAQTEEKPEPAQPEEEEAQEITLEDIRRAIDETHQRIEGADWDNPESETYKKYHRKVNAELKNICRTLGYDKPSLLPEDRRKQFIHLAGELVLRDGVITTGLPF